MCIVTKTLCRGGARESNQNCDYNIVVTCTRLVTALAACDIRYWYSYVRRASPGPLHFW